MKLFWKWSKIGLLLLAIGCTDRFDEVYGSSSALRQQILLQDKSSVEMLELVDIDAEGVCIIEYVGNPKYLPIVLGVQLTTREIYFPPGDQYVTLLFWNKVEWRQVVFKSSELQISSSLRDAMTHKNYCRKGKRITLFKTPFQKSTFTTIVTIEDKL